MNRMKAIWWTGKNKIELVDVPIPEVRPGMVKIKLSYAALCATDLHMVSFGAMNAVMREGGQCLGHEGSGIIEEIGPGAENSGLSIGDKVVMFPGSPCGVCDNCKNGLRQYCRNASRGNTFCEYTVMAPSGVYKIPKEADMQQYALVEPTVCTIRAMDLSPIHHGQTVFISGIGAIGSILLNMVILSGASKITVSDPVLQKRENSLSMGALYAVDPKSENVYERGMEITNGKGYDHVFEVSGVAQAAPVCIDLLAKCGTATYFAVYPPSYNLLVNLHDLYMKEGRIHTVFTNPDIMPRAIDLIPRIQTDRIISKIFDLKDGMQAIEAFNSSIYQKILLKCN